MDEATRQQLLEINRHFYAMVAQPFDATRQVASPGQARLVARLTAVATTGPLRLLDVGCGNGRLAVMLEAADRAVHYLGVDGEPRLLAMAAQNTRNLKQVRPTFLTADLADPDWWRGLMTDRFDVVTCLATLQHLPGYDLRRRLVADLARLATPAGLVVLSGWQYRESERLRRRILDWHTAGVDGALTEPGDALLPWQQDVYAVRYVHQVDAAEFVRLAADTGLQIVESYRADGRSGNLNLYVVTQRSAPPPPEFTRHLTETGMNHGKARC